VSPPTFAVVVPCRDDAAWLRRCLEALDDQTRRPDRVIVVDNASRDDSAAVARAHGATVISEPRHGVSPAVATGYDAVTEDLIGRLDADSLPGPDWVARAVARFSSPQRVDLLTGDGRFYGPRRLVNSLGNHLYLGGMYTFVTPYLGHPPVFGSCMAMRREVWRELRDDVHRHTREIHDDLDLSFQVRPWMTVVHDPGWWVGVSARPFDTWGTLGRRLRWTVTTVRASWPASAPLRHRRERRDWERAALTRRRA